MIAKKQVFPVLLMIVFVCIAGISFAQPNQIIKEEKITVDYHCPQGMDFVKKGLMKVVGVTAVIADLETKVVSVKYVDGQTNREQLVKTIEQLGYIIEDSKPDVIIRNSNMDEQPQSQEKQN